MTGYTHGATLERGTLLPTCLVVLACFCFGTIPYFAKSLTDSGMAAYAIAFYRYGLSALVLFPLLLRLPVAQMKTAIWGVISGVSVGLGWIGFVSALKTVPVSTVGVLYMTYPVFTLLIGWIWFRDTPSKRGITGALMVIMAALIASSPAAVDPRHLPAMLISLSAPISFGFAINVLIHKLTSISPIVRVACFSVGASISLLPLLLLSASNTVLPQNAGEWQLIAGLALGTALLPQLVYTSFAPMIGAARSSVAGSVELPTMFLIGWYTLGEIIGTAQWLACLLITMAILLTPARATRNLSTQMVLPRKSP
ncbi:MAG: DMT family transporter [Gammaproteobacteria bacterium]|nr:DMT family transporter [Gammaproteobacteria bacterium]MDH3858717.1 DMT family transporter [Gammaproteobacteria bacterium]